jgi:hypothetical protein
MGKKTAKDLANHRVTFRMNSSDYQKIMALFMQSGQHNFTKFIISMLLSREMKVVKIDNSAMVYYMRLTAFYSQYQPID